MHMGDESLQAIPLVIQSESADLLRIEHNGDVYLRSVKVGNDPELAAACIEWGSRIAVVKDELGAWMALQQERLGER